MKNEKQNFSDNSGTISLAPKYIITIIASILILIAIMIGTIFFVNKEPVETISPNEPNINDESNFNNGIGVLEAGRYNSQEGENVSVFEDSNIKKSEILTITLSDNQNPPTGEIVQTLDVSRE